MGGLTNGVFIYNQLTFQEVVVETSGVGADRETGGMQMNLIQRDGGNTFSGGMTYSISGPDFESANISDDLVARNLSAETDRRPEEVLRPRLRDGRSDQARSRVVLRVVPVGRQPAAPAGQLLQQAARARCSTSPT